MKASSDKPRHIVAVPYPGRGHINPMLNLCNLLLLSKPNLLISFVVTEEWLRFLSSDLYLLPNNLRFVTLPDQVIPSEIGRAANFPGFIEAVMTKLQHPLELLLDRLELPPTAIVYDSYLYWMVDVGNQRDIPLACFFTFSAATVSVFYHFHLLPQHGHFPIDVSERGDEVVDYIPGLPTTTIGDLPTFFGKDEGVFHHVLKSISALKNAQCVLLSSIYEIEGSVIDGLRASLPIPVYHVGPMIPYFNLKSNHISEANGCVDKSYFKWLDSQPKESVLYISQGSFLSVSTDQANEIIEGIKESGVRFLWVTRGDTSRFNDIGETGFLVSWCDQLKVLCHPSVGGFWTHCGWNSTSEAIYAGVPMLTCPIFWDQMSNNKLVVDDLKTGLRVIKNYPKVGNLVTRQEIAELVRRFMDPSNDQRIEMVERAKNLQYIFRKAFADGGSASSHLDTFIKTIGD